MWLCFRIVDLCMVTCLGKLTNVNPVILCFCNRCFQRHPANHNVVTMNNIQLINTSQPDLLGKKPC